MPDEFFIQNPSPVMPKRRSGAGRAIVAALLLILVLVAAGVGYIAWKGVLPFPQRHPIGAPAPAPAPVANAAPRPATDPAAALARQDTLEGRMAALEQRLDTLDLRADNASGNAARAEALLVAFAARRALDRGAPLGYLEDQLRLRFGNAQPNAVGTVIDAAHQPITLDQLVAGLDGLAPSLTQTPTTASAWTRIQRELSGLFVIRHDTAPSPAPTARLERARLLLESGQTDQAIAEVRALPGAGGATDWMTAARRYANARRALDVLETTAMLDTRGLRDTQGTTVNAPSPVAPPAPGSVADQ